MTKYIFITGGVVSSLGKGLTAASIGLILQEAGRTIRLQKLDPYLNIDPGTMNPYQHGEVYVTEDGIETDLDLGHYERFTGIHTDEKSNFTAGWIYNKVINAERKGVFLGGTIQVIPHITNQIKECITQVASPDVDIVISEIGGTVGDIESLPFMEAIRQFGLEAGKENVLYIHLTLVPYLKGAGEIKTKPTQHSVGRLREIGITPDILIARLEKDLTDAARKKISLFCNVEENCVLEEKDVEHTIYEVPFVLLKQNIHKLIGKKLGLSVEEPTLQEWRDIVHVIKTTDKKVSIAVVGKYSELQDAYKSIYEAIDHGGVAAGYNVEIVKVYAEKVEKNGAEPYLSNVHGVLVPGGFGQRGIEGKMLSVQYAREHSLPFFGICLGMQCAVIEFARNVLGMEDADTTEQNPDTAYPVISLLEEQKNVKNLGGTMRLGGYGCLLKKGTHAYEAYNCDKVFERHRHRYEFNSEYIEQMERKGMIISGIEEEQNLVEIVELEDHPWFVACQFHPEFKSRPVKVHPLFGAFVRASITHQQEHTISEKKA